MKTLRIALLLLCLAVPAHATTIINVTDGFGTMTPLGGTYTLSAPGVEAIFGDGPVIATQTFGAGLFGNCEPRCLTHGTSQSFDFADVVLGGQTYRYHNCLTTQFEICGFKTVLSTPGLDLQTLGFTAGPTEYTLPLHLDITTNIWDNEILHTGPGTVEFIADGLWTIDVNRSCPTCETFTYSQRGLTFDQHVVSPEPATWLLMLTGMIALGWQWRHATHS
jgi:hypothetical protein